MAFNYSDQQTFTNNINYYLFAFFMLNCHKKKFKVAYADKLWLFTMLTGQKRLWCLI
jgi:hypothetical protein